jgi:hypothetical protein
MDVDLDGRGGRRIERSESVGEGARAPWPGASKLAAG